ncbi:MAG: hypothetical protein PHV85_00190 [Desulfovibrionaceae bacterium]|nr:hypothetical protein [Desulfovibrionaceae bacterium]
MERIFEETELTSPAALQEALGISRQAFSQAKNKHAMPPTWAIKLREIYGLNPEWVLTGAGPARMSEFHRQMGDRLYFVRDTMLAVRLDVGRYGMNTNELKNTVVILSELDKLRGRLDERAFRECPDLEKDERLKLYLQGQDRPRLDMEALQYPSRAEMPSVMPADSLAARVAAVENAQRAMDPDATEQDLLEAVIAALSSRLNKIAGNRIYSAREPVPASLAAEESDSCPIPKPDKKTRKIKTRDKRPGKEG